MAHSDTPPGSSDNAEPSGFLSPRWDLGLWILGGGMVAEMAVWNALAPDRTYQVFFSMPVLSATVFLELLWWLFLSPIGWVQRGVGLGAVVASVSIFCSQYTFEGFEGDMIPRFRRRSEPSAQERLNQFLAKAAETREAEAPVAVAPAVAPADGRKPDSPQPESDGAAAPEAVTNRLETGPNDWAEYRGPSRDGVLRDVPAGVDWTKTPTEVWRHPIGAGWSSFAVAGGFAVTQEQRKDQECVVCYEAATGRQIWLHADPIRFDETMGGAGPRATPTIHNSRVYSLGATGRLNCLDALSGKVIWAASILEEAGAKNLEWAMAGSPLVVDGKVIVNPGGANGKALVAYDADKGDVLWSGGSDQASYSAPQLVELSGQTQILLFDGHGLAGHGLDDGRQLWKFEWKNGPMVNASIPIPVDDQSVFIGAGYGLGSALLKIRPDGDNWAIEPEWTSPKFKLKFNPAIRHGDYVYGLSEGVLSCVNLQSGEHEWKKGRYGYGQLLLAGDVLIVQAESGEVAFVKAAPEGFVELHRFPAIEGKTWNHPVVWNRLLLVRNAEEAACFQLGE